MSSSGLRRLLLGAVLLYLLVALTRPPESEAVTVILVVLAIAIAGLLVALLLKAIARIRQNRQR